MESLLMQRKNSCMILAKWNMMEINQMVWEAEILTLMISSKCSLEEEWVVWEVWVWVAWVEWEVVDFLLVEEMGNHILLNLGDTINNCLNYEIDIITFINYTKF